MSSDFDDLRRAAEKLICLFIEHAVKGDDVKLHHILTVENIEVVAKLGLLKEFDFERRMELLERTNYDKNRAERMLKAWLEATKPGRVQ
jgi:hypothetical protein